MYTKYVVKDATDVDYLAIEESEVLLNFALNSSLTDNGHRFIIINGIKYNVFKLIHTVLNRYQMVKD